MDELYQLPGRQSARQQVWIATSLALVAAAVAASWTATQWTAHKLAYTATLGKPLFDLYGDRARLTLIAGFLCFLAGLVAIVLGRAKIGSVSGLLVGIAVMLAATVPVYGPDQFWRWLSKHRLDGELLAEAQIAAAVSFATLALCIGVWTIAALRRVPRSGDTHGSAHFASLEEVEESGYLGEVEDGVILGSYQGRPLRTLRDHHVLVFSPPGTGKSTALAAPTLLTWRGSVLALDIKGELYDWTAAYRQRELNQHICRLDLTAPAKGPREEGRRVRVNPLLAIPRGSREVAEAQAVADLLLPTTGEGDSFWRGRAQELLTALILHVLYCESEPTLARCRERFREGPIEALLAEMILTEHDTGHVWRSSAGNPTSTHPEVAGTARSLLAMAHETRSGIIAHAEEALQLFGDPRLAANTATSDVTASDLMDRERPVSLYLTLPGAEVDRLERVLRLIVSQWLRELLERPVARDPENPPYRHRLLLMLDEFPLLGRMKFLEKAGAVLRGYGVQLFLVVQSVTQLRSLYGNQETISGICPIHLTMGATDVETAKRISERLGRLTVETERRSVATSGVSRTTLSDGEHGRPLLAPDEVARLPDDRLLVLPLGRAPILGERVPFHRHDEMARRVALGPLEADSLTRFEHDWSHWVEHSANRPTEFEIEAFLASWKTSGTMPKMSLGSSPMA